MRIPPGADNGKPAGRACLVPAQLALREQVQWIAELAECTIESPHDRARVESRLARVREALETEPV